jgi:tetratricopeptide (TPR) repeat protein
VIRNRAGVGIADLLEAVRKAVTQDPSLRRHCQESLLWLGDETVAFFDDETDLPRTLGVAEPVLDILSSNTFQKFRARVARHRELVAAVRAAERMWSKAKPPAAQKVRTWFENLTDKVQLDADDVRASLYATPQHWPKVAAALDPAAFEAADVALRIAAGERSIKDRDYVAARQQFEVALTKNPRCVPALDGLGKVWAASGDKPRAVECYRKALSLGTHEPGVYNRLSWYLCTLGEPTPAEVEDAVWAARQAVELAPIPGFWDTLAEALERASDLPGATAAIREAIRLHPDRDEYRARMRRICDRFPRPVTSDSDSEFELTLDETGERSSLEAAALESDAGKNDIFETDFEVPPMESESGSEEVAVESGTDLAVADVADSDLALDDESGSDENDSQVMLLESEQEEEAPKPVKGKKRSEAAADVEPDSSEADVVADEDAASALEGVRLRRRDIEEEEEAPASSVGWWGRLVGRLTRSSPTTKVGQEPVPLGGNQIELPRPITDQVHFSVTAPAMLQAGRTHVLDVWAHLATHRQEVIDRAREANRGGPVSIRTKGGVAVARGTILTARLRIPDLEVHDPEDVITWDGDIGNATFQVRVPPEASPGGYAGTLRVYAGGLEVAKLHFDLEVGSAATPARPVAARETRYRTAFASYASKDRDAVLARVQGIQKGLPDLDIFLDVASLRSGQRWAEELEREVPSRDVFYLFWSANARASEWVDKEWRAALRVRGIDYIDPVPLAPPDEAPPPPELAEHLHFNDWVLAYMRGQLAVGAVTS